jgi:hypothetical protein
MRQLVDSSPTTISWLMEIKAAVDREDVRLEYGTSKYWASFKSDDTNRNVVYLHPQKGQIRLFTRLDLSFDRDLELTPASMGWANMYPTIFKIKSEDAIGKAVNLIISSYQNDLRL